MIYSEDQILEVANSKDKVLYKRLYETYYAALCHYASRVLHDITSEEDIVQEVFIKFWEADTFFKDTRAVTTYFYKAVYNACLNFLRDHKDVAEAMAINEQLYADFNSPDNERLLIEDEYYRQIYLVIDTLPAQRRLIILKTLEGKKMEEIAAEMHISVNTVKTLKKKAYSELRKKLPTPLFAYLLLFA